MSDSDLIYTDLEKLLNEEISLEEKYTLFSTLPNEKKREILKALPESLKRRFIQYKRMKEAKTLETKTVNILPKLNSTAQETSKKSQKTFRLMRKTKEIRLIKNRIKRKAKNFLDLYYGCTEIARYWAWMKGEIIDSYSALEMNMKLKSTGNPEERSQITSVYHQEIEATGTAFIKSLEFALLDTQKPITEDFIKSIHRIILPTEPTHAGVYRQIKVRFPDTQTVLPNYAKVPLLMTRMIEEDNKITDPIEKALRFHFDMVAIHPFTDGNGRTSRLIMNVILMQNDLPPIIINPEDKKNYIRSLEIYSLKGNDVPYRLFMLKQLEQSLVRSIIRLKHLPHVPVNHKKIRNSRKPCHPKFNQEKNER